MPDESPIQVAELDESEPAPDIHSLACLLARESLALVQKVRSLESEVRTLSDALKSEKDVVAILSPASSAKTVAAINTAGWYAVVSAYRANPRQMPANSESMLEIAGWHRHDGQHFRRGHSGLFTIGEAFQTELDAALARWQA